MSNTSANKGGRPKADIAKMAARLTKDLDAAALDPGLAVSKAAICQRAGIPKSTLDLYAEDPRLGPLLVRMREMQEARRAAKALVATVVMALKPTAPPRARPPITDERVALDEYQIAQRYAQATQKARWASERLSARFRRLEHVSNLPAAAYHLEHAVQELHAVLATLRPLAQEWVRRQDGASRTV